MGRTNDDKFLIRADIYGIIPTNQKTTFWFPKARGTLIFDDQGIVFEGVNDSIETHRIMFKKIIKIRLQTLNPLKNKWISSKLSSPFYLLVWNPFWNKFLVNVTFYNDEGEIQELFLKLKTRAYSESIVALLKRNLMQE